MSQQEENTPEQDQPPSGEGISEFVWYFMRERKRLYAFVFSLLPADHEAEEVFQRTSVELWKKFHLFDRQREFYPWACGFARNQVRRYWRAAKQNSAKRCLHFSDELIGQLADARLASAKTEHYRVELLKECLAQLKPQDSQLLSHVYTEDGSSVEYASRKGLAVGSVYNRLSRIRRRLFQCMMSKLEAANLAGGS